MFLVFDVDWWTGFENQTEVESSSGLRHTNCFTFAFAFFKLEKNMP